jgi:hypothetical protein
VFAAFGNARGIDPATTVQTVDDLHTHELTIVSWAIVVRSHVENSATHIFRAALTLQRKPWGGPSPIRCSAIVHPDLPRRLAVRRSFCAEVGRPDEEITKTCLISLPVASERDKGVISLAEAVDRLGELAELGFDQVIVMVPEPIALATIDVFGAQIVPEAAKVAVGGRR